MFIFKSFFFLFVFIIVVTSNDETEEEDLNKIESLCERPVINAADRMINDTVRVYRGNYYWILNGLQPKSSTVEGPFGIPFSNMAPIFRNNTVVTLLGGTDRGKTVKTEGKNYWLWDDKGNLKTEASGLSHNRFPTGGFEAAFHDGNMDDPTFIGFKGIKSYYFSTRYRVWTIDNKPSGYYGGKYNESFPTDLSAAFTIPPENPKDGYIAYFFKRDKYCVRPKVLKSGKECDEWLSNKVLFGCDQQKGEPSKDDSDSQSIDVKPMPNIPRSVSGGTNPPETGSQKIPEGVTSPPPPSEKPNGDQSPQIDTVSIKPIEEKGAQPTPNDKVEPIKNGAPFVPNVSLAIPIVLVTIQFILMLN